MPDTPTPSRDRSTLTVYGGWLIRRMPAPYRTQVRAIVASPSAAAVRRTAAAAGYLLTQRYMQEYWCDTDNEIEVPVAKAMPGVLLYQPVDAAAHGLMGVWIPWSWDWPAPVDTGNAAHA